MTTFKSPERQFRIRLSTLCVAGIILIAAGCDNTKVAAKQKRNEGRETEELRLLGRANARVRDLATEAESLWRNGDSESAEKKLNSAVQVIGATDFTPVSDLRSQIGDAQVADLITEAAAAANLDDLESAKINVDAALSVPHAVHLQEARTLKLQIALATDPTVLRAALVDLPNESFDALKSTRKLPEQLISGVEGLDKRIAKLANSNVSYADRERKAKAAKIAINQRRQKETENARAEASRRQKVRTRTNSGSPIATVMKSQLVDFVSPANGRTVQMLIVTLRNSGSRPIRTIDADIVSRNALGEVVTSINYTIYASFNSSPGIAPGKTWTTPKGQGFILPDFGTVRSRSVSVRISEVSEDGLE